MALFEPKNRVLPLLAGHFAARYSGEQIVLYDRTHHEAFLSQPWRDDPLWRFLICTAPLSARPGRAVSISSSVRNSVITWR